MSQERFLARSPERSDSATRASNRRKSDSEKQQLSEGEGPSFWNSLSPLPPVRTQHAQTYNDLSLKVSPPLPSFMTPEHGRRSKQPGKSRRYVLGKDAMVLQAPLSEGGPAPSPPRIASASKRKGMDTGQASDPAAGATGSKREAFSSKKPLRSSIAPVATAAAVTTRRRGPADLAGETQPSSRFSSQAQHGMMVSTKSMGDSRAPQGGAGEHLQGVILGAGRHRLGGTASAEEPRQIPINSSGDRSEGKVASKAPSCSPHDKRRRCLKFGGAEYYESTQAAAALAAAVLSPSSSSRDSSARMSESDGTLGGLLSNNCLNFVETGAAACQEDGANKEPIATVANAADQAGCSTFNVMGFSCQVTVSSAAPLSKESGGVMATRVGSPEPGSSYKGVGAGKRQQQQRSRRRARLYGAPPADAHGENGKEATTSAAKVTGPAAGTGPRSAEGALSNKKSDVALPHAAKASMPDQPLPSLQQPGSSQASRRQQQEDQQQRQQQQQQVQVLQRQKDAVDSSMLACTEEGSLLTSTVCRTPRWSHQGDLSSAHIMASMDPSRDASSGMGLLSLQQQAQQAELQQDLRTPVTAEALAQWAEGRGGDFQCWFQAVTALSSSVGAGLNELVDFFNDDEEDRALPLQDADWLYSTVSSPLKSKPDPLVGGSSVSARKSALQGAWKARRAEGASPSRPDLGKDADGLAPHTSPEAFRAGSPHVQHIFARTGLGEDDGDGSKSAAQAAQAASQDGENGAPRFRPSYFVKRMSTAVVRAPATVYNGFMVPTFEIQSQYEQPGLQLQDSQQTQKANIQWQKQLQGYGGTPPQVPGSQSEKDDRIHDRSMLGKRRSPPSSSNQEGRRGSGVGSLSTDDDMDDSVFCQQAVPVFTGGLFLVPHDAAAVSDMFPPSSQLSFTPEQGAANHGRAARPTGGNKCSSTTTTTAATTAITAAVAASGADRKDAPGQMNPELMATASSPRRRRRTAIAGKSPSDEGAWPALGGSGSSGSSLRQQPGEGSGRLSLPSQNISYSSYANTPTMFREADEANAAGEGGRGRSSSGLIVAGSPRDGTDAGFKSPSDDTIWPVLGSACSPGHPGQGRGRLSLLSYGSNTNDPGMGSALGSPTGRTSATVARSLDLHLMEHAKDNMASPLSDSHTESTLQCNENLRWLGRTAAAGGGGSSRVLYSAGLSPPVPAGLARAPQQQGQMSLYGSKRTPNGKSPTRGYNYGEPLTKGAAQKEEASSGGKGTVAKGDAAGCFVKVTNSKEAPKSARTSTEEPAKNTASAPATASAANAGRRRSSGGGTNRGCNCKKSKCLKLYCECFSAGLFCGPGCQCQGCHNTTDQSELVSQVQEQIMARDPLAFAPKVIGMQGSSPSQDESRSRTPHSIAGAHKHRRVSAEWLQEGGQTPSSNPLARHKKGCTCKRSKCNKKYCECYQAGVLCSDACKCEGCENHGRKGACASHTPSKNPAAGADAVAVKAEAGSDPLKVLQT